MSALLHPGLLALVFIAQLGSPSYQKREKATQALHQLAPLILPYLETAQKHQNLEVSRRSGLVLASYFEKTAAQFVQQAKPTKWPRLPWLDQLPKEHPDRALVIEYFVAQAREKMGRKGPPDWEDYRLATELYLHDIFLNQQSLDFAIDLLDRMAATEEKWIAENGKNYSPPVKMPVKQK